LGAIQVPLCAKKRRPLRMEHKGLDSERNLYGSPHNLRSASFPAEAKIAAFAVLTRQSDTGRTNSDERLSFLIWTAIVPHLSGGSVRFIRSLSVKTIGNEIPPAKPFITL
jgi:hypothetical protein